VAVLAPVALVSRFSVSYPNVVNPSDVRLPFRSQPSVPPLVPAICVYWLRPFDVYVWLTAAIG
jgi:hypothetical protein